MNGTDLARVESSNLSHRTKSALRRWYEGMKHGGLARARGHAVELGHAVRAGGESLIAGAALGALHAELPTGLDVKDVPIDGVAGVVGLGVAVALAHDGVGEDARNVASTSLGIFAFRKTHDWLHEKKLATGEAVGSKIAKPKVAAGAGKAAGEMTEGLDDANVGEDPIVAAARNL